MGPGLTLPLTSERNIWRAPTGELVPVTLLLKSEWEFHPLEDGRLIVGAHLSHVEATHDSVHYSIFDRSELPNDLVGLDDLKRIGVDLIEDRSIFQRIAEVAGGDPTP
jgi:hypothetical protein